MTEENQGLPPPTGNDREQRAPHPEDVKAEAEGRAYAREKAADYCAKLPSAWVALIGTYGDGDAHDLLDALREDFWSRRWETDDARLSRRALKTAAVSSPDHSESPEAKKASDHP